MGSKPSYRSLPVVLYPIGAQNPMINRKETAKEDNLRLRSGCWPQAEGYEREQS